MKENKDNKTQKICINEPKKIINDGYQPSQKRGYQPSLTSEKPNKEQSEKPPSGGSSAQSPSDNK